MTIEHWPALKSLGAFTHDVRYFAQIDQRLYLITRDDHVFVVGRDSQKENGNYLTHLGLGAGKHSVDTPAEIVELRDQKIVKICQGHEHMLALGKSGQVYAWGWNDYGQLGLGGGQAQFRPVLVKHVSHAEDIACGYASSYVVDGQGEVYAWGSNVYGQLGVDAEHVRQANSSTKVPLVEKIAQVEAFGQQDYVLAVSTSGQVFGWGEKSEHKWKPTQIESSKTLTAHSITTTRHHGFILDHEGHIHVKVIDERKARLFYDGQTRFKAIYGHKGHNETLVAEAMNGEVYAWWNVTLGGQQQQHPEVLSNIKHVADAFALTGECGRCASPHSLKFVDVQLRFARVCAHAHVGVGRSRLWSRPGPGGEDGGQPGD